MDRVETLISFFGDRRAGQIPPLPQTGQISAEQSAVIAEACSKSNVVWLRCDQDTQRHLVWQVWHDGALHVVYGVGEQVLPMLSGMVEVTVPSKEKRSALLILVARAQVLAPRSPAWDDAVEALRAARLNTPDPDTQLDRWAQGCLVSRLDPVHVLAIGPGDDTTPSQAAPPRDGSATTTGWRPWHLGGRASRTSRDRAGEER